MGQTIDQMGQAHKAIRDVVEVRRHGEAIIIPESLSLERVRDVINARIDYENQEFIPVAEIDAPFVFEAAFALNAVLTEKYGWANSVPTPGFFGPKPPAMISVPVALGKTVQVPWGRFSLPNIGGGYLESGITEKDDGRIVFQLTGKVKRLYEPVVNEIVEAVKLFVRDNSIYRNKAFRVKLFDNYGNRLPMPEPEFIDLNEAVNRELVLPERTAVSVETNIFTPIRQTQRVARFGIPLKRGILLAGPFGTGKTMIATATANLAIAHGWTYVECKDIGELAEVVRLARQYGDKDHGVVLFCEDIDRVMRGDNRTQGIDDVLNVIDGVESKGSSLMIVLTTNELEKITTALLRPGRLDAIIHVGPPDADAAERLARMYGRGTINDSDPLTKAKEFMAGKIPAVIREVVERAKLYALSLDPNAKDEDVRVTDDALAYAAQEMDDHVRLLAPKEEDLRSETLKAADAMAAAMDRATEAGLVLPFVGMTPTPSVYEPHRAHPDTNVQWNGEAVANNGGADLTGPLAKTEQGLNKRPASQSKTEKKNGGDQPAAN